MRALNLLLPSFALLASLTGLAAQDVVGLTHQTPLLVRQQMDFQNCSAVRCQVTNQARASTFAGGTAFDGRMGAVWLTNGSALDVHAVPDGLSRACRQLCPQQKVPFPPSTGSAIACTGMCFLEAGTLGPSGTPGPTGRIYFTYTEPRIGWADVRGCTLTNFKFCTLTFLGSGSNAQPTGGLACDDVNRLLFIGARHPTAGAMIYVVDADNPCMATCRAAITVDRTVCGTVTPLADIRGLAFDPCARKLTVTDGTQTVFGVFDGKTCQWTHRGCCSVPSEEYTGLAPLPFAQTSLGRVCTVPACNACPTMRAETTGAAVMGNAAFSLDIVNAPSNASTYALAIGLGGCAAPGVGLGFCENALVSLAAPGPLVFFFSPTSFPSPPCNGAQSLALPLPMNQSLCNFAVSFQWVVQCRGNPVGNGVSNCVTFRISAI